MRQLLLLATFLPLGARFSLDSLAHGAPPVHEVRSLPALALMLQVTLVLAMTGVLKTFSPDWTETGLALYYAAHQRHTGLGTVLLLLPMDAFPLLTRAALGLELLVPLALWCPIRTSAVRRVAALSGMLFLLVIWLTMSVGILPLLTAVALIIFLPGEIFERIGRGRFERVERLRASGLSPRLTSPANLRPGRVATLVCALLLIDIVGYNLESIPGRPLPAVVLLRPLAERAGVMQSWPMFSAPSHVAHWVAVVGAVEGKERSASHLADDLEPADAPRWRSHAPHGYRWLKLFESMLESGDAQAWQRVARVLCDTWQAREGPRSGRTLTLYAAQQEIMPGYVYGPIGAERLALAQCAAER